ncbi:hypothetical protein SmJEL517_g01649 [Synchytrium microbalum]|uniref:UTP23 sensor motif region domain-containing protein n=1 Tax=Synchytrium microbalum TaxID=1806994 RepID=A0A507C450_9FUNG|nr:uncharacterized protein SmJEL517_g01649 [Synchytrium microbalum]TPX36310.1 hypothetical protein SmJEL517_g01649 [Synchytrium microbalum]
MTELRELGLFPALNAARDIELRKCHHTPRMSPCACLTGVVGPENKHRYCVATQDKSLRSRLRNVPGIPLVYFNKGVMILEPASAATDGRAQEMERSKMLMLPAGTTPTAATTPKKEPRAINPLHPHRRKTKGPNPLSVKKKAKRAPDGTVVSKTGRKIGSGEGLVEAEDATSQ